MQLRNINKKYKDFELRDINLEVEPGQYLVALGPSGAGKTLILEIVAGLLTPDSGEVAGVDRGKIGFIYQDYMLFPHLDVFDNVAYGLKIRKVAEDKIRSTVKDLLERLQIGHLAHRDVGFLSGGEKQRVAIARAMAIEPEIMLLDEPTAALDRNARVKTRALFMELHKQIASTFIHVTHDFEEALALADRLAVIMDGRIVQFGPPGRVFNHPVNKNVADFLGYRNVFGGPVQDGTMALDGITVTVPLERADLAYAAIRSDDIIVSREPIASSARNSFSGTVKDVIYKAAGVEVVLDVGVELSADITRKSCDEMDIRPGTPIWATFKVSAVKVFQH